jgi:hypothetical protein
MIRIRLYRKITTLEYNNIIGYNIETLHPEIQKHPISGRWPRHLLPIASGTSIQTLPCMRLPRKHQSKEIIPKSWQHSQPTVTFKYRRDRHRLVRIRRRNRGIGIKLPWVHMEIRVEWVVICREVYGSGVSAGYTKNMKLSGVSPGRR